MKYLFSTLLLACSFLINAQDFEVAPVIIDFTGNPGEIQQEKVTIRNHSNIKQDFTFTVGDYQIDESGKQIRMKAGESKRSLADWITINPGILTLNPNEEKEINVIITVPKDGNATKWGMIYVQAATEQKENPLDKQLATGILVKPRIVILVNQSPKSNNSYHAEIQNLKEVPSEVDSLRAFDVTVENTGDKIIEAKVQLVIANLETAIEQKFDKEMKRVFPGEKRTFTLTLPKNAGKGKYALAAILDYGHGTNLEATQMLIEF